MPKTIHFNTGRKYTRFGQRITATWHDDGKITFMDHSRSIFGEIPGKTSTVSALDDFIDDEIFKSTVMIYYDRNDYDTSQRAYEDGMMKGGCNVEYKGP